MSWVSEDLQSSRRKFDLEHSEGDLCWSQNQSDGRKGRVECHLRRGDGLVNKRKWENREEWGTWRRVADQGQSLGDTARRRVPGRQVTFTFGTEATRWQIWLEPAENRTMDTKPGWEAGDQDLMVNSDESSREVEYMILSMILLHWQDDREYSGCTKELFQ